MEDNKKELEENLNLAPKLRSEFSDVHGQSEHFQEMGLYAVGMVMKHKRYHYICVIYGWDAVCKQSKVSHKFKKCTIFPYFGNFIIPPFYMQNILKVKSTTHVFPLNT